MISSQPKAHHMRHELCTNRPAYRSGRELRAVKVYTVSQESRYLLVQGIPALGVHHDLIKEFALYGAIEEYRLLDDYPAEEFTEVIWIKFVRIQSARVAKKKLDNYEFCGGQLHVCYAPEYETIDETRTKLNDRRRSIAQRLRHLATGNGKELGTECRSETEKTGFSGETVSVDININVTHCDNLSSLTMSQPLVAPSIPRSEVLAWPPPLPMSLPSYSPLHHDPAITQLGYPPLPTPPVERFHIACVSKHFDHVSNPRNFEPSFRLSAAVHRPDHVQNIDPQNVRLSNTMSTAPPASLDALNVSTVGKHLSKTVVIKDYKTDGIPPRFVPRQVVKKPVSVFDGKVHADPVIEELKQNALVLGQTVQGPSLPVHEETKRKTFMSSETGNLSIDGTVKAIREKVLQFSDCEPPKKKSKES